MQRILAIDPGLSGGLALLEHNPNAIYPRVVECLSMPTMPRRKDGTGEAVNYAVLAAELERLRPEIVVLEQVTGMMNRRDAKTCRACKRPFGPGASGLVNFGIGYGVLIGVAAKYPQIYVHPSQWKKRMQVPKSTEDKDRARTLALQIFPYCAEQLKRKKDVGRAEAILIGLDYCNQLAIAAGLARAAGDDPAKLGMCVPAGYTMELEL